MRYALGSDVGSLRENNEDRADAHPDRGLFVVADGMGGHVAGEVASRVAVDSFVKAVLEQKRPRRIRDEMAVLEAAVHAANDAVVKTAEEESLVGMGTTLTGVIIRGRTATVVHVGDSRAYFAHRKLRPLTRDHTMASWMVQSGILSEDEADDHPERHVLTQAIGTQRTIDPDVFQARIPHKSQLLLCTDGLYDVVPPEEILEKSHAGALEEAVQALIDSANAHGGPDNITVILIDP